MCLAVWLSVSLSLSLPACEVHKSLASSVPLRCRPHGAALAHIGSSPTKSRNSVATSKTRKQFRCQTEMDTLGIEPRASRMLSGCDTTTPCAQVIVQYRPTLPPCRSFYSKEYRVHNRAADGARPHPSLECKYVGCQAVSLDARGRARQELPRAPKSQVEQGATPPPSQENCIPTAADLP